MNYSKRLDRIEAAMGPTVTEPMKETIAEQMYNKIVHGLQMFGYDRGFAEKYARLSCDGFMKYGFRGYEIDIEKWEIVPVGP